MIDMLGSIVETRNLERRVHVERVKAFTQILGTHMMQDYPEYGLTQEQVNMIADCSALHDVGKIMISDSVLLKPGKLTADEFEYVKSHSLRGYELACDMADVWDEEYGRYIKEITRSHHEKYDGRGYPDGLKGDDIPISAQLVSIADCFDSLITESVYKEAIPYDEAYDMIVQGECGVFSYKLLECFRKARTELVECAGKYAEE
jgi:putative two-component system response regulator